MKTSALLTSFILSSVAQALPASANDLVSVMDITNVHQESDACIYDYTLKKEFQDLPRPDWLKTWDQLMANTFCASKYDVKLDPAADKETQAKMLLFSLASGFAIDSWHPPSVQKRFAGIDMDLMMTDLWENGGIPRDLLDLSKDEIEQQAGPQGLVKRTITQRGDQHWVYDHHGNLARVLAMRELENGLHNLGDRVLTFNNKAVCHNQGDWRACLLWSGGDNKLKANTGKDTIASAVGGRSQDSWISAYADNAFKAYVWSGVHNIVRWHRACVSNRPDHCG